MKLNVLAAAVVMVCSSAANAANVYSHDFSGLGELASPGSIQASFNSAAGFATLDFVLNGYASLDGNNFYTDIFTLNVNGTDILSGTFNMGGGGASQLFTAPAGTTWSTVTTGCAASCTDVTWQGGQTTVSVSIALVAGLNNVAFSYDSPTSFNGNSTAGPQGTGDEGWGLGQVNISAVPEPDTYAMILAGVGLIGYVSQRRRRYA